MLCDRVGGVGPGHVHQHVRVQSPLVQVGPRWAHQPGSRDVQARAVAQLADVLDRPLAVRALTNQLSAGNITHTRGDHFGRAGRASARVVAAPSPSSGLAWRRAPSTARGILALCAPRPGDHAQEDVDDDASAVLGPDHRPSNGALADRPLGLLERLVDPIQGNVAPTSLSKGYRPRARRIQPRSSGTLKIHWFALSR